MKRSASKKLADSSDEIIVNKSLKLEKDNQSTSLAKEESVNDGTDFIPEDVTDDELCINFTETPYYKLTKLDSNKINVNLTPGYIMIKIHDTNTIIDDINKLIPSGISGISGYYKIPNNSIKIDFLHDFNGYFHINEIKLVYLTHGSDLFNINNYNSNFIGYTAVICINNTGRSIAMVKHCSGQQHFMKTNFCIIARSFYTINILPQIIGTSMYLVVYITTTEKFSNTWPKTLFYNKNKDSLAYINDAKEDNYLTTATNIERTIYKNVEAFILNSVLLEDLKTRLNIIKQINTNIDSIFYHNDNILISDILKRSTDSIIDGMSNTPVMSDILMLELKRSVNIKNKIRNKLLKSALNSKDVEEILSYIPSEEGNIEQLKFNQNCTYEHFKKVIDNTRKEMDIGCRSIEHSYVANLYKVYGQNEYMINYILALINRVNCIMESLKHNLIGLDEGTVNNINSIILMKTRKK
ncbi:SWPV1-126 [Shearwaterpox virus]|uniref:SWPV1-126 n=1 Tax=Shearwaterpox virus TaxID=1974596 RepID=A0A1V0S7X0_CNPV|nr:SWPV1-126 [Shearwaterpox virus]